MKRSRRGGRRPQNAHSGHNGGGGHSNGGGGGGHNPNRTYDSTGPEIKVRGSAAHVYEKYLQMARDANTMGDRVMAENYLQHAEHYFRILAAAQAQQQQYQAANGQPANGQPANGQPQQRQPGVGEQPYVPGTQPQPGPSFSLADTVDGTDEDEGDDSDSADGNH